MTEAANKDLAKGVRVLREAIAWGFWRGYLEACAEVSSISMTAKERHEHALDLIVFRAGVAWGPLHAWAESFRKLSPTSLEIVQAYVDGWIAGRVA